MRRLRVAAIVLCSGTAALAVVVIAADRRARAPGPGEGPLPSFYLEYQCTDARDEFASSDLDYDLRLDEDRWVAYVTARVSREGLRAPCRVDLGVPAGARNVRTRAPRPPNERVVTLARHGSRDSGAASVLVRPLRRGLPPAEVLTFDVVLPRHDGLFRPLGLGLHFFRFELFGPAEAGSFRNGEISLELPRGHSVVDASPDPAARSERWSTWALAAGRDREIVVTYRRDLVRTVAEVAPEALFGALALLLAVAALPARARPVPEAEPPPPPPRPRGVPPPPPPPAPRSKPRRRRLVYLVLLGLPVVGAILRRRLRR